MNFSTLSSNDRNTSEDAPPEKKVSHYQRMLLTLTLAVLAINITFLVWGVYAASHRASLTLSDLTVTGQTALCPGETLEYKFLMTVTQAAVVEVATSEQKLDGNERISFARVQEFEFDSQGKLVFGRFWVVPKTYTQPATGLEVPWEPGRYEQRTIATIKGRSDIADVTVPFVIRDNCEG